jgi:hypothetical protein
LFHIRNKRIRDGAIESLQGGRIDASTEFRVYWHVFIPLSQSALAAIVVGNGGEASLLCRETEITKLWDQTQYFLDAYSHQGDSHESSQIDGKTQDRSRGYPQA